MQYSVEDLVRLAKRDNNSARPYLYVNPKQGKHIPANPKEIIEMCESLAETVNAAYPDDDLYVIGFAETATGIASVISRYLNHVIYYQNTTREDSAEKEYIYFTESHSHATDQLLRTSGIEECLKHVNRVLFIDDEVTTGNTIYKLIEKIEDKYSATNLKFSIVSVLNSMTDARIKELNDLGVECIYLSNIPFEYKKDSISDVSTIAELHRMEDPAKFSAKWDEIIFDSMMDSRNLVKFDEYEFENEKFISSVREQLNGKHYEKVGIIGTEEIMYPTIRLGEMLQEESFADTVKVHSTTRSPIIASGEKNYPLYCRYQLRSLYDERRITYIYNLESYDIVIITTDARNGNPGIEDLCSSLYSVGNSRILLGRWRYE